MEWANVFLYGWEWSLSGERPLACCAERLENGRLPSRVEKLRDQLGAVG
ncbi:MAG: hypothetical protein M5U34_27075 [Chloroflexi bacterium]|nr:hypothetical protein [Chloroflexota bacterium]